jgi:hypothetical protein
MPHVSPEQVQTLHHLINEAANAATGIAEALATLGSVDGEDPQSEMMVRVNTTKALRIRDSLVHILDSLLDDPS